MRLIVSEDQGGTQLNTAVRDTGTVEVTLVNDRGTVVGLITIHIESEDKVTIEPGITPAQIGEQVRKLLMKLDTLEDG